MTHARTIISANSVPAQVRRAAQQACSGMRRNHVNDRDVYFFPDGSRIVVARRRVFLQEQPF